MRKEGTQIEPQNLQLHFVLSLERSGSTLLSSVLNANENVISPIEEPFVSYNYHKYKHISSWNRKIIESFVEDAFFLGTTNMRYLYPPKDELVSWLTKQCVNRELTYLSFCKLFYLRAIPEKNAESITCIVDKQIRLAYDWRKLSKISNDSKFVVLKRNPVDNVASRIAREMGPSVNPVYLAEVYSYHFSNTEFLKKEFPDKVIEVLYEDLVSNTEITIRKVCQFLDIEFVPQMLNHRTSLEFLESKVDDEGLAKKWSKHAQLKEGVHKENIDSGKALVSEAEAMKISNICKDVYPGVRMASTNFSFMDRIAILRAFFVKQIIFRFYLLAPLSLKKGMRWLNKKVRKRKL